MSAMRLLICSYQNEMGARMKKIFRCQCMLGRKKEREKKLWSLDAPKINPLSGANHEKRKKRERECDSLRYRISTSTIREKTLFFVFPYFSLSLSLNPIKWKQFWATLSHKDIWKKRKRERKSQLFQRERTKKRFGPQSFFARVTWQNTALQNFWVKGPKAKAQIPIFYPLNCISLQTKCQSRGERK